MAEQTEYAIAMNRRHLLAAASAATTAAVLPPVEPTKAAAIQPAPSPEVAAQMFSAANAKRLLEITRRNRLRKEAGLPLLSIPKEIRLMKTVEAANKFAKFSEAFRNRVRDKTLARIRRRRGEPHWMPEGMLAGIGFETEVSNNLRTLYKRIG